MAKTLIEFIAGKSFKTNDAPVNKAAAAGNYYQSANNGGASMIGTYYSYVEATERFKQLNKK